MSESIVQALERRVTDLERQLRAVTRRAGAGVALSRSTAPSVDTGPVQTNQGRIDPLSLRDGMTTLYSYGFSSSLPIGGDKLVVFLGGDRSQGVVVATGHQDHRFAGLAEGEVVVYDKWGHSMHFTETGIRVTGDLQVTGAVIGGYGTAQQVGLTTHHHVNDSHGDAEGPPVAGT